MFAKPLAITMLLTALVTGIWGWPAVTWSHFPLVWGWLNLMGIGFAYLLNRPAWVGKKAQGRLSWWSYLVWLPYLITVALIWRIRRLILSEDAYNTLETGAGRLYIGRRIMDHEALPIGLGHIVDMTAEFREPEAFSDHPGYLNIPVLDGSHPRDLGAFQAQLEPLAEASGDTYVHCAYGHGRAALAAAALLLLKGLATDAADAFGQINAVRPGTRLNREQQQWLQAFAERLPPKDIAT